MGTAHGIGCRAIFISDVHLGTRACRAGELLDFLRVYEADTIYIVGDMVDFWQVKHRPHWPQAHNDVLQKLLRKVRKGSSIVYVPGNHDEAMDDFVGMRFGGIRLVSEAVHETADGKRLLVTHGDDFDGVVKYAKWLAFLGDRSYVVALWANGVVNAIRGAMGLDHWSLSAFLKQHFKRAVKFISDFETALSHEAERRGLDGVICGHIHHAADKRMGSVLYRNCGDWVESCTALVEHWDGRFELVRWLDCEARETLPVLVQEPALEAA